MDYQIRVWRCPCRVCECLQDVGVTFKDVRVLFNGKGLPFQSVWMSF